MIVRQMQPKLDSVHMDRLKIGSKLPVSKDYTWPALLEKSDGFITLLKYSKLLH